MCLCVYVCVYCVVFEKDWKDKHPEFIDYVLSHSSLETIPHYTTIFYALVYFSSAITLHEHYQGWCYAVCCYLSVMPLRIHEALGLYRTASHHLNQDISHFCWW